MQLVFSVFLFHWLVSAPQVRKVRYDRGYQPEIQLVPSRTSAMVSIGPCPNRKLLKIAASAPVRYPASGPNASAVMIIMALTGLKFGSGISEKAARPTTHKAAIRAMGVSSLAFTFFRSKTR